MVFTCNGTVSKWIYGGERTPMGEQPELQIWRPMDANNYLKIGASRVDTNVLIDTNVYEYIPDLPLVFQEGDMFGAFNPHNSRLDLYEQYDSGPINLFIDSFDALLTITGGQPLTSTINNFPLVTVEIISK